MDLYLVLPWSNDPGSASISGGFVADEDQSASAELVEIQAAPISIRSIEGFAMDGKGNSLKLTAQEVAALFTDPVCCSRFPPLLTIDQAAELLQIPVATLYDWRSRGLLGNCSRRLGKHVRFYRDRLIHLVFNEGI
jgi:excisionase family DNA binding protein